MTELLTMLRQRWKLTLGLVVVGFSASAAVMATVSAGLAMTNTEQFCISCHVMKDNVYLEYKGTIHDANRTGVRATCPDCHVPHEVIPLLQAKIRASGDLYRTFISPSIDTREKFVAKRHELASRVWKRFMDNDSHECRNCHKSDSMSLELQSAKAQVRHTRGKVEGITCIACHFAIAHKEPDGLGPRELFGQGSAPAGVAAK